MNDPLKKKDTRVTVTVTEDLDRRFRALMARGAFGPGTTVHAPAARTFFRRMADRMEAGLAITTEPLGTVPQKQGVHWMLRLGKELHGRLADLRHDHPIGRAAGTLTSFVEDLLWYGVPLEEEVLEGRVASRPERPGNGDEASDVEANPCPMARPSPVGGPPASAITSTPNGPPPPPPGPTNPEPAPLSAPMKELVDRFAAEVVKNEAERARRNNVVPPAPSTLASLSTDEAMAQFVRAEVEILAAGLGQAPVEGEVELVEPLRSVVDGFKAVLALQNPPVTALPPKRRR